MALLSRVGLEQVSLGFPGAPSYRASRTEPCCSMSPGLRRPEARAVGADCGGIRVWSLYVAQRPHARLGPLRVQARSWFAALRDALAAELSAQPALVAMGDFNVAPTDAESKTPRQKKKKKKKKIVYSFTNTPVYITGEDGWSLATQLDNADADTYLSTRASQGFNLVWAVAADNVYQSNAPDDYYGYAPFSGSDFTNEDANYWTHVDSILQLAASYGIAVGLDPGFAGLSNADGYRGSYLGSSDAVVNAYGVWIGSRYRNYPNIVWILGGDADPTDTALYEKLNQLATGIRSADSVHLITFEAARFYESGSAAPNGGWSSLDAWGSPVSGAYTAAGFPPAWLTLNWVYDPYSGMQAGCSRNYSSYITASPNMPQLAGEDWYEGEHSMTELQLREEAYWEVLSGCTLGRIFGNNPIWCFNSTSGVSSCDNSLSWQTELTSNGSLTQQYMGALMRSREFWKMAPDTSNAVLTGGYGSGTSISVASCTSDGQTCIVYDPVGNAQDPHVAMGHFSGTVHAWWFNPQTGTATDLSTFSNSGTETFTPPDGNDWVLVLDLDSANLAAPGSADL